MSIFKKQYCIQVGLSEVTDYGSYDYEQAHRIAAYEANKPENDGMRIKILAHDAASGKKLDEEIYRNGSALFYAVAVGTCRNANISYGSIYKSEALKMAQFEASLPENNGKQISIVTVDEADPMYGWDNYMSTEISADRQEIVRDGSTVWYALQVGDEDEWDCGSFDYDEVCSMAQNAADEDDNEGEEIRILSIDEEYNECENVEVFREAE